MKKSLELWKNQSWLLHHDNAPAHMSLLVRNFLVNNNTVIMPQPSYSPDFCPCNFLVSKTEETHERTNICYDWGDKNCIAGRAQDYTKKCLSQVLQGLEKTLAQVYYIWRGLLWRKQYRYWWINKYFLRKIKIYLIFLTWTNFIHICNCRKKTFHCLFSFLYFSKKNVKI